MKAFRTADSKRAQIYLHWDRWLIGYVHGRCYRSAYLGPFSVVWATAHVQVIP